MAITPCITFPQAPLRSRTAGFPGSGSDLDLPSVAFPKSMKLKCWLTYTPLLLSLLPRLPPFVPRPFMSGYSWDCQVPRAPSRVQGVTSHTEASSTSLASFTLLSSLLRAHATILIPPHAYGFNLVHEVFAGCCQPLLGIAPSRRYLCWSFSTCLDPYSGALKGASIRSFPLSIGLLRFMSGSAVRFIPTANSVGGCFRSCSHSLMFKPVDFLTTLIALTLACFHAGQLWLLRPRISQFVTSLSRGYANRPNRTIGGKGTSTPQNQQPCRPLP